MKKVGLIGMTALLAACLEPQLAPQLAERSSADFTIEVVADGLNTPWGAAELADGSFVVTEKQGALKHIKNDGEIVDIKGLPSGIFTQGQGGLLDVHAEADGHLLMSHSYGTWDANGTALIRAKLEGDRLVGATEIYRAAPPKAAASHFGGRIQTLPGGDIILTLGDGFSEREAAQNPESHLGKIMRIHANGAPPAVYTLGHRNVQGVHYDAQSGALWAHEHGPRGGDELNLIIEGENYGWPVATSGLDYNGAKISPFKTYDGMTAPVHDWVPSIAPSGLTIYRGELFAGWNGDAFVGGLASRDLRHLKIENGKVIKEEKLLGDMQARIRDVRTGSDGSLLILNNTKIDMEPGGGQLLRLTPKK